METPISHERAAEAIQRLINSHFHPRPPVDYQILDRQLRELLDHERTFPPGRANSYDRRGNEIPNAEGER